MQHRSLPLIALVFMLTGWSALWAEPGVAALDSMSGQVSVTPNQLSVGDTFEPVGVEIKTGSDGWVAVVFSNGVALYLTPNTTLRISEYDQTPFTARPDDFEFEPSRSQLRVALPEGEIGVAQRDPNPSSDFIIEFGPDSSVSLKAKLGTVIHDNLQEVTAIFDGRGSMHLGEHNHLFSEGYRFLNTSTVEPDERIWTLTTAEIETWKPLALNAQTALRRWYFQTPEEGVIQPIRVAPPATRSNKPYNNTKL